MPDDVTYGGLTPEAGAIPLDTKIETQQQAGGEHRQVIAAGDNYMSELALGNIAGRFSVNKFGHAPAGVQTTETDIYDRADATPTQQVWLAPTAARIHTIASSSTDDNTGGTGVDTVVINYLPDWDTAEATEEVSGDLNAGIAMQNAAVIIHRMSATAQATTTNTGLNEGTITATAAGDGTVTAAILPGNGQTEMAIYGVPSTQNVLVHMWSGQIDKAQGQAASVDFILRVNDNPNIQTVAFKRKDDLSVQSNGTSAGDHTSTVPLKFAGPLIMKVTGTASLADTDAKAGFDLEVADK